MPSPIDFLGSFDLVPDQRKTLNQLVIPVDSKFGVNSRTKFLNEVNGVTGVSFSNAETEFNNLSSGAIGKQKAQAIVFYIYFKHPEFAKSYPGDEKKGFKGKPIWEILGGDVPPLGGEEYVQAIQLDAGNDPADTEEDDSAALPISKALRRDMEFNSAIILSREMEKYLDTKCVKIPGKDGIFTFRNIFNRVNWLREGDIDKSVSDRREWITDQGMFYDYSDGYNFVLVREDGARVTSGALHYVESWFLQFWHLYRKEIITVDALDVMVRYVLLFARYRRSEFLRFYFHPNADKIDNIIRTIIVHAKRTKLNMRDFDGLDTEYDVLYRNT